MLTQYRCDNTHRPLPHPAAAATLMPPIYQLPPILLCFCCILSTHNSPV